MKKICFVVFNFNGAGGMERVNADLIQALAQREAYDITLLSLFGKQGEEFFRLEEMANVRVKYLIGEVFNVRLHAGKMVRAIEDEIVGGQYEVVVSGDLRTYFAKVKERNGEKFKLILWEHFNCTQPHSMVADWGRKYFLKYADWLVVLSKRDRLNTVRKFGCEGKIRQIYNPIVNVGAQVADVRKKRILSVGRIEEQKGYDLLVDIAKRVAKRCDGWCWDIVGDGSGREWLQKRIDEEGLGEFLTLKGACRDIHEVYPEYSIFALTSRYEGLSMVLLEAYSHRLPLISFDCDCGPSEIVREGENGFLVPCFDCDDYAEKLVSLMNDEELRRWFSEHCRLPLAEFDVDYVLDQWERLFDE